MKIKLFLILVSLQFPFKGFTQTVDFNSCTGAFSSNCNPFYSNQFVCGNTIKIANLFGSPNFITFKKRIKGSNVDAKAVLFQSLYFNPFNNLSEGIALETPISARKAYIFNVVATGQRGQNNSAYIPRVKITLDKNAFPIFDDCNLGDYTLPSTSFLINDFKPSILDTFSNFQESVYTDSRYIVTNQDYPYLGIRAEPTSGVPQVGFLLHKIVVKELKFQLQKSLQNLYCNVPANVNFTLNNPDNILNVTSYKWDLGTSSNGWIFNGNPAPQIIVTSSNTLPLSWTGTTSPSSVSVIPFSGSTAFNYLYTTSLTYSNENPPDLTLIGPSIIRTNIPTNNNFSLINVSPGSTIVWDTPVPDNLGTFITNGSEASFMPNSLASGTLLLKASITNICGTLKELYYSISIKNACDELTPPSSLNSVQGFGGNSTLSWESRAPANYLVEIQSTNSNFSVSSGTNSYNFYYGSTASTGQFRVKAFGCPNGQSSDWSDWKTFNFSIPTPPPPANSSCSTIITNASSIGSSQINVEWEPSTIALGYNLRLDRCCGGGSSSTLYNNISGNSTIITAPFTQASYYLYIQVVCTSGVGPWVMKTSPVTGVYRSKDSTTNYEPFIIKLQNNLEVAQEFNVYPNPVDKILNLKFNSINEGFSTFILIDQLGRKILQKQLYSNKGINILQIDISTIPNGIYSIQLLNNNQSLKEKIIIQKK